MERANDILNKMKLHEKVQELEKQEKEAEKKFETAPNSKRVTHEDGNNIKFG